MASECVKVYSIGSICEVLVLFLSGLQILICVFWSDPDPIFELGSDLDPVFKIWSDPDPVFFLKGRILIRFFFEGKDPNPD